MYEEKNHFQFFNRHMLSDIQEYCTHPENVKGLLEFYPARSGDVMRIVYDRIKDEGLALLFKEAESLFSTENKIKEFDESLADLLNDWPNKTNGDDKTVAFIGVREAK